MILNVSQIQAIAGRAQARFAAAIVLLGGGDAGMPHRVLYRDEMGSAWKTENILR